MKLLFFFSRMGFFLFLLQSKIIFCCDPISESDSIPKLALNDFVHEREGFYWKNELIIQKEGNTFSFEETHKNLYNPLKSFREKLEDMKSDICILVMDVVNAPDCPQEIIETFKNLNEDDKTIADFIDDQKNPFSWAFFIKTDVKEILNKNYSRLGYRNACTASFEYINENGERRKVPIYMDKKPVIFLSGIGNELIRILERHEKFNDFYFIIFHNAKTNDHSINIEHFRTNLENLYCNILFPEQQKDFIKTIKTDVLRLTEAEKRKTKEENEISETIKNYLNASETEEILERRILEIPNRAMNARKAYKEAKLDFKHKFCDSEQALRYFLFAHIKTFLEGISLKQEGMLVLNIHSEMDPCKRCTNALALECFLSNQTKFAVNNPKMSLGGFFHRIYNDNQQNMPGVFILVSSQRVESEGGMTRRLTSGGLLKPQVKEHISSDSTTRLFFRHNNGVMGLEKQAQSLYIN